MKEKDINSLDHATWRCQYHVVFAPKYRCGVRTEIPQDGNIPGNPCGYRKNTAAVMPTKGRRNHRSRSVPGSYPYPHP